MKTPGAVLLWLWLGLLVVAAESGGDQHDGAASTQQHTCQPDIHTVLREMSVLLAEQRVELRHTKTQLEAMEKKAETTETRLRASENTVEEQRAVIRELKEKQEEQTAALTAVGDSVTLTGSRVEEQKALIKDMQEKEEKRKVSFSASLVDSEHVTIGPFNTGTTLVFKHIFTNTGSAYNPNTGIFTAPVRGVYHFTIHIFGDGHQSRATAASLNKNGEHVDIAYSAVNSHHVAVSNGASLLLEVGDVVHVKLWPTAWVRDTESHHTTFSGHLLFTM